ncbi:Surface polysaccharide O-acyltransferase, integral membrane enzyme [Roseateles sp. YR242]|uniref:acyltransferase family protein n=1 Tax=Roseateles sp. YR242 TaxID=1855305 RepID=UPI0008B14E88|nr:acyltransferase [Roseateles sp. YR242]SEL82014.1 Surface polysaccharide O-acyltransferase, integral membrane enzyme [Roseateles sp. YR242]
MNVSRSARQPGIDALRILGAVLVVGLHVGAFPEWPHWLMATSRAAGRWVVPFFFVVMGYFVGIRPSWRQPAGAALQRVWRLVVVWNVIYAGALVLMVGLGPAVERIVSSATITRGVWGPLWFLHSALAALLVVYLLPAWLASRWAWLLIAAMLMVCSAVDSLTLLRRVSWEVMYVSRFVGGIGLVWLGVKLASIPSHVLSRRWPHLLMVGLLLGLVQAYLLYRRAGAPTELQMPVGAMLCGVAAMGAGFALPSSPSAERMADWGRRLALGIYLLHPLMIETLRALDISRSDALWAAAAGLSIGALLVLERWLPGAKARLDGQ